MLFRNRFVKALILIVLIISTLFSGVISYACDLDGVITDVATNWCLDSYRRHMGQKATTYRFANSSVQYTYSTYAIQGFAMWGDAINCVHSGTSPNYIETAEIIDDNDGVPPAATATILATDGNNHVTRWKITINVPVWNALPESQKRIVMAHELGHVYGLGHSVTGNTVMADGNFNNATTISDVDFAGMSVVTRVHTHQGSFGKKYTQLSNNRHRIRCTTCAAKIEESCAFSERNYHSGDLHYWVKTCVCGRTVTQSWYCSGNPCITPNGVVPETETQ